MESKTTSDGRAKLGRWVLFLIKSIAVAVIALAFWLTCTIPAQARESRVLSTTQGDIIIHETQELIDGCADFTSSRCWKTVSQVIEGGRFVPPTTPPRPLKPGVNLLVDATSRKMMMYHLGEQGTVSPIEGWVIVTVRAADLPADEVEGFVRVVDRHPTWCPTKSARAKYPKLPSGCLPPGHELNAMGVAKILIDWQVPVALKPRWVTRHIHGAAGFEAGDIFADETLGCVRLLNEELWRLLALAGPGIKGARVLLYR